MVDAPDGLIIVDTTGGVDTGREVLKEFRKISNKTIKALIYTHQHPDHTWGAKVSRVKLSNFGHQVNSDIRLQTVEIQMRRLLMSRLIRIFTVCLVNLFFSIPVIKIGSKQGRCPNLPDARRYLTLPYTLVPML